MRFVASFVTAFVTLAFIDAVLASPHNSNASLRKRHVVRTPPMANVTTRDEGAILDKRFGPGVRFSFFDTGLGACGKTTSRNDFIVAMNQMQYGNGEHCFETITITYKGKSTPATVVDKCMECPYGALDFSRGLFDFFASEGEGYIYGSWVFGSGDPEPTPTPKPEPTTTKVKPTTTHTPDPTTTSTTKTTSTTHTTSSSSSSVAHSTTTSTSTTSTNVDATPSNTAGAVPTDVFAQLDLAMVNLGGILIGGVLIGAAAK